MAKATPLFTGATTDPGANERRAAAEMLPAATSLEGWKALIVRVFRRRHLHAAAATATGRAVVTAVAVRLLPFALEDRPLLPSCCLDRHSIL